MCGRFALRNPEPLLGKLDRFDLEPQFNIAPGSKIILETDKLITAKWGFTPYWANESFDLINARSETLWKKNSFKDSSKCLIPADGWYEWKVTEGRKVPYFFENKGESFFFAGIYGGYRGELGAAIVTMEASSHLKHVHNRMPVLINEKNKSDWLDKNLINSDNSSLVEAINYYQVSTFVNNPTNQGKQCVEEIQGVER